MQVASVRRSFERYFPRSRRVIIEEQSVNGIEEVGQRPLKDEDVVNFATRLAARATYGQNGYDFSTGFGTGVVDRYGYVARVDVAAIISSSGKLAVGVCERGGTSRVIEPYLDTFCAALSNLRNNP